MAPAEALIDGCTYTRAYEVWTMPGERSIENAQLGFSSLIDMSVSSGRSWRDSPGAISGAGCCSATLARESGKVSCPKYVYIECQPS
jgi:hypothetical protein